KRNQLRTKLSVSAQLATQPPDKRAALIGAVATVVLVLCVGVAAAKIMNRTETQKAQPTFVQKETPPIVGNQSPQNQPNQTTMSPGTGGQQTPIQQPQQARPQGDGQGLGG